MKKKAEKATSRLNKAGQSLVEMALSLMVVLYILAGAVNFGMAYFSYVEIRDAAQEGVVYGSIHPPYSGDTAAIEHRIKISASTPVDLTGPNVTISVTAPEGPNAGNALLVTVKYQYPILLPFINLLIGTDPTCGSCIPLQAKATGVILVDPPTP